MAKAVVTLQMLMDAGMSEKALARVEAQLGKIEGKTDAITAKSKTMSKGVTGGMKQVEQGAGLAGAAVTAFSAGLSDIPFGIRGVANNIGQLGTLMGMLTATTGSLTGALKLMWKQMMGPLGIVVAIQAALAGLQIWDAQKRKSRRETKKLTESLSGEVAQFNILAAAIKSENITREQRGKLIATMNKQYGTTLSNMSSEKDLAIDLAKAYDDVVQKLKSKAIIGALQEEIQDLIKQQIEIQKNAGKFAEAQAQFAMKFGIEAAEGLDPEGLVDRLQKQIDGIIGEYMRVFQFEDALIKDLKEKNEKIVKQDIDFIEVRKKLALEESLELMVTGRIRNEQEMKIQEERVKFRRLTGGMIVDADKKMYAELDKQREKDKERMREDIEMRLEILRTGLSLMTEVTNLFFKAGEKQSKRQFEMQKKFNIATTLIDTWLAAQGAYKSQFFPVADATSPIRGAIAAATAVASGLARVNAIRQQQFTSSGSATGMNTSPSMSINAGGDQGQLPRTGFTLLRTPDESEEEIRVVVLEKDIRSARLNNDNSRMRATVQ